MKIDVDIHQRSISAYPLDFHYQITLKLVINLLF
jgi:hypothetical protein